MKKYTLLILSILCVIVFIHEIYIKVIRQKGPGNTSYVNNIVTNTEVKNHSLHNEDNKYQDVAFEQISELDTIQACVNNKISSVKLVYFLSNKNKEIQNEAFRAIQKVGKNNLVSPLVALFKSEESSIRNIAVKALCYVGSTDTLGLLIELLDDPSSDVRASAINTIYVLGGNDTATILVKMLSDKDDGVKSLALTYVCASKDVAIIPTLEEFTYDSNPSTRQAAIIALSMFLDEEVISYIEEALNDEDAHVRAEAIRALSNNKSIDIVSKVKTLLNDNDVSVKAEAITYIGNSGDKSMLPKIIDLLSDNNTIIINNAIVALINLDGASSLQYILPMVAHENPIVALQALECVDKYGDESSVEKLLPLLSCEEYSVRRKAENIIKSHMNDNLCNQVLLMLYDDNLTAMSSCINIISSYDKEEALRAIKRLLDSANKTVRMNAAKAIGNIGDESYVEAILPLIDDSESQVRVAAVYALKELNYDLSKLELLISDRDVHVKEAIINIYMYQDDSLKVQLAPLLKDESAHIRKSSLLAIASIGDKDLARKLIMPLLNDTDTNVSVAAIESMKVNALGSKEYSGKIFPLLDKDNPQIHIAAISTLIEYEDYAVLKEIESNDISQYIYEMSAYTNNNLFVTLNNIAIDPKETTIMLSKAESMQDLYSTVGKDISVPIIIDGNIIDKDIVNQNIHISITGDDLYTLLVDIAKATECGFYFQDGGIMITTKQEAIVWWKNWLKSQE